MAGHTPYGYKIVDVKAVIDEPAAEKLRQLYLEFVECGSMRAAATKVGIEKTHSVIGRLLNKELYTGTDYYPAIIDKELFDKAQERRKNNARSQNRIRPYEIKEPDPEPVNFYLQKVSTKV